MGTDISGWVEVRKVITHAVPPHYVEWHGVIKISDMMAPNYNMFSCLFGVTTFAAFDPIAYNRGLPQDISREARVEYAGWEKEVVTGESWLSWSEVLTIDWAGNTLDTRPRQYKRDASGQLVLFSQAAPRPTDIIAEGNTWEVDGIIYKVERITRQEVRSKAGDWDLLFRLMEVLAQTYGEEGVRLVVWFDQ